MSAAGAESVAPRAPAAPGSGRGFAVLLAHLLSLQARSVAIWGTVLGAFGVMMVAVFPGMSGGAGLEQMDDALPQGVLQAAGVESLTSMGTIEGFLEAEIFGLVLPLALPFFAILAAAAAIAGAEENGTIDVLMGNPLSRWQLVAAYFVAIAVSLAAILAIFGLFLWGSARFTDAELPLGTVAEGVFGAWPLCIFFGGLALLFSAIFHRRMLAVGLPGAVLVAMYSMDSLGGMVEEIEWVRNFSAVYHYGSPLTEGIGWASFAGVSGVALLLAVAAAFAFRRRDIYT